jgi:hypothetical protein
VTPQEETLARNEALFREANERVEAAARRLEMDQLVPFICECGRTECMTIVRVTLADYERVRAAPTHFLYASGHEQGVPKSRAVETLEGAVIVEKTDGPGRIAVQTDPRASQTPGATATG